MCLRKTSHWPIDGHTRGRMRPPKADGRDDVSNLIPFICVAFHN